MRRFFKPIVVVLTISLSAFLIGRSCHDDLGDYDPDKSGGISQAIRPAETESLTASVSPAPVLETKENAVEQESRPVARHQAPAARVPTDEPGGATEGAKRIDLPRADIPRPDAIRPEGDTTATSTAANTTAANEKLEGTWVLSDGNTRMELKIVNGSGVLTAHISEAGRSFTVEQRVRLLGGNNTVYVFGSERQISGGRLPAPPAGQGIVLAFNFAADGSPQVVWHRGESGQSRRLNVISHAR